MTKKGTKKVVLIDKLSTFSITGHCKQQRRYTNISPNDYSYSYATRVADKEVGESFLIELDREDQLSEGQVVVIAFKEIDIDGDPIWTVVT